MSHLHPDGDEHHDGQRAGIGAVSGGHDQHVEGGSSGASPAHDHPHHEHEHEHQHGHEHRTGPWGWVRAILSPHSHDSADSIDNALESNAAGIRAVRISLVALGCTALVQLAVVLATSSVALLADTIHNFSDALTGIPLWIAFSIARRPATRRYTYGFGRAEDLAGMFVVLMITMSAVIAGYESVSRLVNPEPIGAPWVVLAAGIVGFAGNELVAIYRIKVGRQIGSAALVADGIHARTDGFTSLAVALGAVGVLFGFPLADPLVGILITVAILVVLRGAVTEVFRRLMDGVDPETVHVAEHALSAAPGVLRVLRFRMRWDGHRLTADATISVDATLPLSGARSIAHEAEHRLTAAVPKLMIAEVHPYPSRQSA